MKKRWLAMLAAGLLSVLLLSGCAQKGASGTIKVDVWTYYNGPQWTAFNELIGEFNESVGIEKGIVVTQYNKGGVNDLINAVTQSATNAVGADPMPSMFAAYADTAYEVDQLGAIASLDSYLTQDELDEYIPGYIEEGRFDSNGSLKIFPIAKSTEILMLNKTDWDKFSAATGADIAKLETIEGITEVAEQYYNWSGGKAFFGRDVLANYILMGFKQLGKELFSVSGGKVSYDLDGEIFHKLWDNFYVPYVKGYFMSSGTFRSDDIHTGTILAMVCSTSGASYFPQKAIVDDNNSYEIEPYAVPFPYFADGKKVSVQQGAGMVVSKTDERTQAACVEFLKWFTEKEHNIKFSVASGYLPVKTEANDVNELLAEMRKQSNTEKTKVLQVSIPASVSTVKNYEMYTSKAFQGGTEARKILESSMLDWAKKDTAEILQAVADAEKNNTPITRAQAAQSYLTRDHFESWLRELSAALTGIAK